MEIKRFGYGAAWQLPLRVNPQKINAELKGEYDHVSRTRVAIRGFVSL
jgi:hypothetical protein